MLVEKGSMLGEEDVISEEQICTCTAKCHSMTCSLFSIKKEEFLTLKHSDEAWLSILEKALWKETKKDQE